MGLVVNERVGDTSSGFWRLFIFPVGSGDMSSTIDLLFAKKKRPDSDEQAAPNPTASEDPSKAQYVVLFTVLLKDKQRQTRE